MHSVVTAFNDACARRPEAIALQGVGESLTYAQLDALTDRVAGGLAEAGVEPGRHVAIFLGRSPNFVVTALGVLKAGGVYVPIDPEYPVERQRAILGDLASPVGVVDEAPIAPSAGIGTLRISDLRASQRRAPAVRVGPNEPAYVMFTSGSTGVPKGSVIPHRGIVRLVRDADFADFGPNHRWALLSSVAFDASTLEIWGPLLNGGTCVVLEDALPSLDRIAEFFQSARVTDAWLTAALFNSVVDYRIDAFAGMRQVFTGGETESPRHFRRFLEACPAVRLVHGYGPTENTTFSLCHSVGAADVQEGARAPIGRAIRGTTIRIVGPDGADVPPGVVGQLLVGGLGVALGYLNKPELTKEKFFTLEDGTSWYRTGDLVRRRSDELVEFLGRVDRQIKVRGFRIEPEEIEKALTSCPGVTAAVVEAVGADAESRRLVAYCAAAPGAGADAQAISELLAQRLPAHMLPSELHVLPELPLGPTGKVDRRRLRPPNRESLEQPAAGMESTLAEIWRGLLPGVPIGPQTDFFAVGGHSVLVLKMVARIRRDLSLALAPSTVYRARTLRRTAEAAAATAPSGRSLPKATVDASAQDWPCSSMQRSLAYEWRLDPMGSAYHVHAAFLAPPELDTNALGRLFLGAVARHDALRMRLFITDQGLRQRFQTEVVSNSIIRDEGATDWTGPGEPLPEALLERVRAPFDIENASPARLHLLRLRDGRRLVVFSLHHATVDDWSLDLVLRECEGPGALPAEAPPAPSILRYAAWERDHLTLDEAHRRGAEFAQSVKAGYPLAIGGRGAAVEAVRKLEGHLPSRLSRFAVERGVTPFVVLLAAYALLIRKTYAVDSPWILTPFANRTDPETAGLVGCCIDLRLMHLARTETFGELVGFAAAAVLREHDHAPLPLEEVSAAARKAGIADFGPAMQFALTYRVDTQSPRTLAGTTAQPVRLPAGSAKFGLLLQFEHQGDAIECAAEASANDFTGRTLMDLCARFEEVLATGMESPDAPIGSAAGLAHAGSSPSASAGSAPAAAPPAAGHNAQLDADCRAAWCRALSRTDADDRDDFFQCGGTSLLVLRLAAEIRRHTGVSLPLGLFVERPTFENLRALARGARGEFPLVTAFGDPKSETVVFAIPGLGGNPIGYHVLWLELRRLLASPPLLVAADFKRIAELIRDLKGLQPVLDRLIGSCLDAAGDRPFALAGYSLGGLLAPEIARQLTDRGRPPDHVWLLDPYSARFAWPPPVQRCLDATVRFARMPWRIPGWIASRLKPHGFASDEIDFEHSNPIDERRRDRHLSAAFRRHEFGAYAGPVTFLRSSFSTAHAGAALADSWHGMRPYLSGPCRFVDLDIAHTQFLRSGAPKVAAVIANEFRLGRRDEPSPERTAP